MSHPRAQLEEKQLASLQKLVSKLLVSNAFYQDKLAQVGCARAPVTLEDFRKFPFTTKDELADDRSEHPPYGSNLTYPFEDYTRFCQTSGTSGVPMAWLDTNESWASMLDCWQAVFRASGVASYDRIFFAFSFGPFLGFWTAYEAASQMGCLAVPGGGMSSTARLACMETNAVTVLCCTPTYALRLGEAIGDGYPDLAVRTVIVAGEPGGSLASTRARISELWRGATVCDHHGMTEVGPVSFPTGDPRGILGVLEEAYLAEVISEDGSEVDDGETGELVLTTLRRDGCPVLRYRTGDLVRKVIFDDPEFGETLGLEGGILGRIDDMVVVRGVNVYPGGVEEVVRRFSGVAEYQVVRSQRDAMVELEIVIEPAEAVDADALRGSIERAVSDAFALRIPVSLARPGALPRFEFKSSRWIEKEPLMTG